MKLGWRKVLEPNKIWARVLAFKYCVRGNLLYSHTSPLKLCHCNTWRGVVEHWQCVEENAGMALGDGRVTQF